jgi:hypothetical protein
MANALNYFHKDIQIKIKQDNFYKEVLTESRKNKSVSVDLTSFFEANLRKRYQWLDSRLFGAFLNFALRYMPSSNKIITTWHN